MKTTTDTTITATTFVNALILFGIAFCAAFIKLLFPTVFWSVDNLIGIVMAGGILIIIMFLDIFLNIKLGE